MQQDKKALVMVTLSRVECEEKGGLKLDEDEERDWITVASCIISVNEEEPLTQWEIFPSQTTDDQYCTNERLKLISQEKDAQENRTVLFDGVLGSL